MVYPPFFYYTICFLKSKVLIVTMYYRHPFCSDKHAPAVSAKKEELALFFFKL